MGCCFSKKEASSSGKAASPVRQRRSPPPTEPEAPQEETVKEVLSETAKPRARPREEAKEEEVGIAKCLKAGPGLNPINDGYNERFEENSEVCSVSEGFSVSTTVTEKRGGEEGDAEEVEVQGETRRTREEKSPARLQRKRSVSGGIARNKERSAGVGVGCRSGRASPSPVKRREGAVGRTYSAREAGQGRVARSRVPAENGFRKDPGERSGRRSISPAAKRAAELRNATAGGQCKVVPASRANGRASPSRIPPVAAAAATATADGDGKRLQEASGGDGGEGKESLENPLVSLECFIFL
ncbi:uncharacterized protein [Elaeis guineensis]|uniref:Uncharacterized protein LOC105032662 n=1 Tax=Elaeis guineensis var. tenera TaxID=51953 RepID=A0A6I9Q8X9_ELAGV|nr:uncharacterized protein LOC105032662 [Elaeis guineensis]